MAPSQPSGHEVLFSQPPLQLMAGDRTSPTLSVVLFPSEARGCCERRFSVPWTIPQGHLASSSAGAPPPPGMPKDAQAYVLFSEARESLEEKQSCVLGDPTRPSCPPIHVGIPLHPNGPWQFTPLQTSHSSNMRLSSRAPFLPSCDTVFTHHSLHTCWPHHHIKDASPRDNGT